MGLLRQPITVSEQGEPVPSATTGTLERPASESTDSKGGPLPALAAAPAPVATAPAALALGGGGSADESFASSSRADLPNAPAARAHATAPPGRVNASPKSAPLDLGRASRDDDQIVASSSSPSRSPYGSGAAGAPAAAPPAAAPASPAAQAYATPPPPLAPPAAAAQPSTYGQQGQSASGFTGAMAAYNAGDYATATALFDGLAGGGDLTSALWAARSVRRGSGCAPAAPRFDQVARAGAGTTTGYDATFEGGQCYRQMGQSDAAQTRFRSLLTVTSYVDRAKNELAQMGPKPSAKSQSKAAVQQAAPVAPQQLPPGANANKQQAN